MVRGLTPPRLAQPPRRIAPRRLTAAQRVHTQKPKLITPVLKPTVPEGFTDLPVAEAIAILFPTVPSRSKRTRQIDLSGRILYLESLGFTPSKLVGYFKDEGGGRQKGETGYVLSKLLKPSEVPSELKSWYDSQVAITQKVLRKAKKRVTKNIAKLKASGKDYERSDIVRIYKNAYPKWSEQYKRKAKELPRKLAYEEKIAVWRAGQAKYKEVEVTDITVGATTEEQATAQAEQATGMSCPATVNTYIVKLKDGSIILVDALQQGSDSTVGKDTAKAKAEAAGYDVAWVTKKMSSEKVSYKKIPTVNIPIYSVDTQRGPKTFIALNEEQAQLLAESYGLEVKDIKKTGEQAITEDKALDYIRNAYSGGSMKGALALTVYGSVLSEETVEKLLGEDAELPPADSVPIRLGTSVVFLPESVATQLKDTPAYAKAKGSVTQRLGIALATWQQDFESQLRRNSPALYTVYKNEGIEAYNLALEKQKQEFVSDLKEGNPELYEIYEKGGWSALNKTIEEQNEEYAEFQAKVASGTIIALPDGTYITKENFDKQSKGTQQILEEGGFTALGAATELIYAKKGKSSDVFPARITREEYGNLNVIDRALYSPAPGYGLRAGAELAVLFFPPIKATLPEYTMADVSAMEWAIGIANVALIGMAFAPGAIAASAVGKAVTMASASALGGMIGYQTAKNWSELTPAQRAVGVGVTILCAVPILTTVARGIKITSTAIPTRAGAVTTWKGLKVAGHPIIGKSGGQWVLGTRNITLPEARLILNGYKPEMMLETKVFVNRTALIKAGFSKAQVDYVIKTLKYRNLFAGKVSPWLDAKVMIEPTQRLNAKEIEIIMRRLIAAKGKVKNATMVYGSPSIKAQLAPKLRGWRSLHDWDISLTMSEAEVRKFTQQLLAELKAGGGGIYRISPKHPTLIEKKIGGKWQHIADIHQYEISSQIPGSRLDATGQYSYGRMVSEPALTVRYPGVGDLQIMRLSESGVRKADTILRVRQTATGTAFRPPERGIAQPGVPKDAADFYVILRSMRGEKLAEDWLKSWARAMGYTEAQLVKVLPKIRTAMLEVAANTPSDIIGYRFIPSSPGAVSAAGATTSITIHIPSSLGPSVSGSLARRISQPIYPYNLARSPSMQTSASASAALLSVAARFPSAYPLSSKLSPMVSAISRGVSLPSPVSSGYPSPSLSPSGKPRPRLTPRPRAMPIPSIIPSPSPKPIPSPTPSPAPGLVRKPKPAPPILVAGGKGKRKLTLGSITWRQGSVWKYITPPWKQVKPLTLREAPIGAVNTSEKTPEKTIQMIGKPKAKVPESVSVDLGVVDILIEKYGKSISFTGKGLETVAGGSIAETTKGMSIPATSPQKVKGYTKLAFGTSTRSLTTEAYNVAIPKKFADKILSQHLGKMSSQEIASEIKDSKVSVTRKAEILKMLLDRVRRQVELWLTVKTEYAPAREMPKAVYVPTKLRRKKQVRKPLSESEAFPSASAIR